MTPTRQMEKNIETSSLQFQMSRQDRGCQLSDLFHSILDTNVMSLNPRWEHAISLVSRSRPRFRNAGRISPQDAKQGLTNRIFTSTSGCVAVILIRPPENFMTYLKDTYDAIIL